MLSWMRHTLSVKKHGCIGIKRMSRRDAEPRPAGCGPGRCFFPVPLLRRTAICGEAFLCRTVLSKWRSRLRKSVWRTAFSIRRRLWGWRAAPLQCGARLLVLPELCLTGYTCGDLFLRETLIEGARATLASLCAQTRALPVLIVAGLPVVSGAKLYNCAAVVYQGRVLGIVPKTHLPNYGEFYERRWFVPAPDGSCGFVRGYGEGEVPFGRRLFQCEEL